MFNQLILNSTLILILQVCWLNPVISQDVTINITGPGSNAQYIEEGKQQQEPVGAKVGHTIRWQNDNTNREHTATAAIEDSGEIIFDTATLASDGDFKDIEMTQEVFEKAGGTAGGMVTIKYECDFHSQMVSYIVLCDEGEGNGGDDGGGDDDGDNDPPALRVRRNILSLNSAELTAYRDAWRAIQTNGNFATLAGFHGCPMGFCHQGPDGPVFLPWHREYLLRFENALTAVDPTVALHYWDWASDAAAINGIPSAFTDSTYVSGGSTFQNPLRRFAFVCPAGAQSQITSRFPGFPFSLSGFAGLVDQSYFSVSYLQFNSNIESPHNNIHGWIGGDMGAVRFAAYDPVFWAHHSNVDRQWSGWQENGGPGPSASASALPLRGFAGRTAGNVTDFKALGYEYDQYDTMAPIPGGLAFVEAVGGGAQDEFRKSFSVNLPASSTLESTTSGQEKLNLTVKGIPDHPKESFVVHVFINSPNPTKDDIRPNNPNYLGQFAIFGGQHGDDHPMTEGVVPSSEKRVLQISTPAVGRMSALESTNQQNKITILAMNTKRELVPIDRVPIESVRLESFTGRSSGRPESNNRQPNGGTSDSNVDWREFVGLSTRESFDEAYKNAATKAQGALGGADQKIVIEVLKVGGVRGTIAGRRDLEVRIRARIE